MPGADAVWMSLRVGRRSRVQQLRQYPGSRFWQICDVFNIPVITLVDTLGMMVGPEVEKSGLVRHCSRLFVIGANLETPRFGVILRKGYALGSLAVMTGSSRSPLFTVS